MDTNYIKAIMLDTKMEVQIWFVMKKNPILNEEPLKVNLITSYPSFIVKDNKSANYSNFMNIYHNIKSYRGFDKCTDLELDAIYTFVALNYT